MLFMTMQQSIKTVSIAVVSSHFRGCTESLKVTKCCEKLPATFSWQQKEMANESPSLLNIKQSHRGVVGNVLRRINNNPSLDELSMDFICKAVPDS